MDETQENTSNSWFMILAVVALLVVGGYWYWNSQNAEETDTSMTPTPTETSTMTESSDDVMIEDESDVVTVEVDGGSYYFKPNVINVNEGDVVKIVFTNVDGVHDFVLDAFDVRTDIINTDEVAEVTFVADQAGEFEYYCSVGNHRAQGMVGTLVVQ